MATIVILEHELQREVSIPYMIYAIGERWRARGHRVLVHHGLRNPPPGDIAVNNIDLTVVPLAYRGLFARYPKVINGEVLDVSKSRFSQNLVSRDSGWQGPVIVKTEANYGGKPEQLLRSIAQRRGNTCDIPSGPVADGYPVYRSLDEVPSPVWETAGVIVERFLPEQDDRGYYIRMWNFLGDREYAARWRSPAPVVKSEHYSERETVNVPEQLRAWRENLRFDYGRFDFVRRPEGDVLLDVNRTSSVPRHLLDTPAGTAAMELLAQGLAGLLA